MATEAPAVFGPPRSDEEDLSDLNSDPDFLALAATLPGFDTLLDRRRQLDAHLASIVDVDVDSVRTKAVRAVANGADPLAQARKVTEAQAAASDPSLARKFVAEASRLLFADAETWFEKHFDALLGRLRRRVIDIRKAATPLVEAGMPSLELLELATEFDTVTGLVERFLGGEFLSDVIAPSSYVEAFPGFYTPHHVTTPSGGATNWKVPYAPPRWEDRSGSLLEWVIENDIDTWVPSREEAARAARARRKLQRQMQAVHNALVLSILRDISNPRGPTYLELEPIGVLAATATSPYGTAPVPIPEPPAPKNPYPRRSNTDVSLKDAFAIARGFDLRGDGRH